MSDSPDVIDSPSCSDCGSDEVERIEGGAVGVYRCLNCGTEFNPDDDSDHAKSN